MITAEAINRARNGKRARYDEKTIHDILDKGLVGHVGFVVDGRPVVMPMAYARDGHTVYLHGASKTRIVKATPHEPVCLTVTLIDGLVAARSGFHHSVNYRSAVVHGLARAVKDAQEHDHALQLITEHLLPGRYDEIRPMTPQERKATGVVALTIEAASAKVRDGGPVDDAEDEHLGLWGGVLPVTTAIGRGVPDSWTPQGMGEPASLARARAKFAQ
jgi:nitroimidazol reductase NimA-like FMN-containing flavoprotein (pyridoxamine 5'-phosphate oxidase superfamily)